MTSFLIDPLLLTIPSDSSNDEVETWWQSTSAWLVEIQVGSFEWRQVLEASNELVISERFITFRRLQQLERETGVPIAAEAVRRLEHRLLSEEFDYLPSGTTSCVVCDPDEEITPSLLLDRNLPNVRPKLRGALTSLAVDKALGTAFASELRIASQSTGQWPDYVTVCGRAAMSTPEEIVDLLPSGEFGEQFQLYFEPDDLVELGLSEVLAAGPGEFLHHVERMARRRGTPPVLNASLHPEFFPSVQNCSIANNNSDLESLFRRCADIVSDTAASSSGARLEQIRTSAAGSAPPLIRSRDRATGMRASVTMGAPGWRLNFWKIPSELPGGSPTIEFGVVESKHAGVHLPE